MEEENYNVVAVMSGTSLDGVDLAHVFLSCKDAKWTFKISKAATVPYTDAWVQTLKSAVDFTPEQLESLNKEYTLLLSGIISDFIKEHNLSDIDAVCSHGHTIQHRPQDGFTLQIGNLPEIATLTGQKVVCDFRVQDVQLGGQGAPLVPIGDRLLFGQYTYCLNLGGFSNISFEEGQDRIAFDICPVNTVLNHYANRLGFDYDDGGKLAAGGKIIPGLLKTLNGFDFYRMPYPKSLGFEFVKEVVLPIMERYDDPAEDKLRTFTEHIAFQIAEVIRQKGDNGELLITGGGAYNTFLINRMAALLPATPIYIPDNTTIQYKEALIFALLGVLKLRNEVNVLSSVTGAQKDHSSGRVYLP